MLSKFELSERQFKRTKSPVKPSWNDKITVLSTVFESPLNYLYNDIKNHYNIQYSKGEKWCKSLICKKDNLKVMDKIDCKTHLSKKITVLSTFLESSLNLLFNDVKNITIFGRYS